MIRELGGTPKVSIELNLNGNAFKELLITDEDEKRAMSMLASHNPLSFNSNYDRYERGIEQAEIKSITLWIDGIPVDFRRV